MIHATWSALRALTVIAFLTAGAANAATFTNQFVEFTLPNNWKCALEGAEWVCQSLDDQKKRDAIIVLAAKLKGDQDTLIQYQDYLTKPRIFTAPGGKPLSSQPKYAKMLELNGTTWVDALHLESEIPGFFTRYLATIKNDIAVLVTYSINRGKYVEYQPQFDEMVKSLKVFRKAGTGINTNAGGSLFSQATLPGSFTSQVFASPAPAGEQKKTAAKDGDSNTALFVILIALVAVFLIWKRAKNRSSGGGGGTPGL